MNTIVNILMSGDEIFGISIIPIFLIIMIILGTIKQDEKQKRAHEKVIELTEKGHDAKLCPKCNGKGGTWGFKNCSECGDVGYIYKLKESAKGPPNTEDKVGL